MNNLIEGQTTNSKAEVSHETSISSTNEPENTDNTATTPSIENMSTEATEVITTTPSIEKTSIATAKITTTTTTVITATLEVITTEMKSKGTKIGMFYQIAIISWLFALQLRYI